MLIDFQTFDTYLSRLENGGNKAGYFLGMLTGPFRIAAGKVIIIASLILGVSYLMAYALHSDEKPVYLTEARRYGGYFAHGVLNVIRGFFEMFTFSGGIFILAAYDYSGHRFHYFYEEIEPGSYTLNPYKKSMRTFSE